MAVMSPASIAQVAQQAGFRGNAVNIAVAIAMAESSGNSTATHLNTDGSTDYGLWQINSIHSQYSPQLLLSNPLYNATAAYQISSSGSNFHPWTTYETGAYKKYLNLLSGTPAPTPVPTTLNVRNIPNHTGKAPWWTFPRVDNMGTPDAYGGFPKPDSNIQVPTDYPIIALLPGVVSGTNVTDGWGASITIKLDKALNVLADHTSYIHLRADLQVRVGQHVTPGQLIAYNGSAHAAGNQKVPLGFALYHGSSYGHDGFQYMTYTNVTGLLNPVPLLNSARAGTLTIDLTGQANIGSGDTNNPASPIGAMAALFNGLGFGQAPTYTPLTQQIHDTLVHIPGFYGIALTLDEAEQFPGWINLVNPSESPLPDFAGIARSIGATITDNTIPFVIRSGVAFMGFTLLLLLLVKPVMSGVGVLT